MCWLMVVISTFIEGSSCVPLPHNNNLSEVVNISDLPGDEFCNVTGKTDDHVGALYTGYSAHTFRDNFNSK